MVFMGFGVFLKVFEAGKGFYGFLEGFRGFWRVLEVF